jgi:hypothetical protein
VKTLNLELLDQTIYVDRAKTITYAKPGSDGEPFTVRSYLLWCIDLPVRDRPMTPSRLNSLNKLHGVLSSPEHTQIEDADLDFLKTFINERGIDIPMVYAQVKAAVDAAS